MRWGWYESPNGDPSCLTPSSHRELWTREQKHSQERTSKLLTPKVPANPMKSRCPKGCVPSFRKVLWKETDRGLLSCP